MVKTIDARVLFGIFMLGAMLLAAVPEDPGVDSSDAGQLVWDTSEVEPEDDLFRTSDRCLACHKGVVTSDGLDVSIGYDWRASMMANSARDPYWQAAVRREVLDYPDASNEIEDNCSSCHMPMARTSALMSGRTGSVFANLPVSESIEGEAALAVDGVSCAACHQISQDGLELPTKRLRKGERSMVPSNLTLVGSASCTQPRAFVQLKAHTLSLPSCALRVTHCSVTRSARELLKDLNSQSKHPTWNGRPAPSLQMGKAARTAICRRWVRMFRSRAC